ncbi:MAG: hypothetical protein KAJ40_02320, partial [Alphaproteobacteria bacterium]|nr:hypothetical protein [Alphaproteobacteria bacterium]
MKKVFDKLKQDYESSDHDIGVFIRSLKTMSYVIKKKYDIDADWLVTAALHHLKAKTKTYIEDKRIGLLGALLVGYGSSFNQVMLALCEWFQISETKVKNAYYAVCKEYDLPRDAGNLGNDAFMSKAEILPYIMMIQNDRAFPKTYKKSYKAFLKAYHKAEAVHVERILQMIFETENLQISMNDVEQKKEIIKEI